MSRSDDSLATHHFIFRPPAGLSWQATGVMVAATTLLVIVFAGQGYVGIAGDRPLSELVHLLVLQSLFWYLWLLLAPAVFAMATKLRLRSLGLAPRLACWVAMAFLFAGLHTASFMAGRLVVQYLWGNPLPPSYNFAVAWWSYFKRQLALDCINFALVATVYEIAQWAREARERARIEADLSARLAAAELGLLRMQLQPHFLFNALNTVSSLMEVDKEKARSVLADIGDLFRMAIERLGRPEVRLSDEIEFLRRYLEIQQTRFSDRLRVDFTIDPDTDDASVPSLILQPLVENAIRHGVEPRRGPVTIRVATDTDGSRLRMTVANTADGGPSEASPGAGIGLQNTRDRLKQMYGDAAMMNASLTSTGEYVVTIAMPLRTTAPAGR